MRRSSFREKEKAARKLDTSFKDVLYANEQHDTYGTIVDNVNNFIFIFTQYQLSFIFVFYVSD